MKLIILASLASYCAASTGGNPVYTYYEAPLFSTPNGEHEVGAGPSQWGSIGIHGNQCDGIGQSTGYGQSPIMVPISVTESCDATMQGYEFTGGDCTWDDLDFAVFNGGVKIGVDKDSHCTLGMLKIPGKNEEFEAKQIFVRAGSEHGVGGRDWNGELVIAHEMAGGHGGGHSSSSSSEHHGDEGEHGGEEHGDEEHGEEHGEEGEEHGEESEEIDHGGTVFEESEPEEEEEGHEEGEEHSEGEAHEETEGEHSEGTEEGHEESGGEEAHTEGEAHNSTETEAQSDEVRRILKAQRNNWIRSKNRRSLKKKTLSNRKLSESEGGHHEIGPLAYVSIFLEESPFDAPHPTFDWFLKGWEHQNSETELTCAFEPDGTQKLNPNSYVTSRQERFQCPAVGNNIDIGEIEIDEKTGRAIAAEVEYPSGPIPNIYTNLTAVEEYGAYTYLGSLTQPPCTETVHWSILDTPMLVSQEQLARLYYVILCFVEVSTCRHASIANEDGYTVRPYQPLLGRTVTHRCPDSQVSDAVRAQPLQADPVPPTYEYHDAHAERCAFGGDGGPLGTCWSPLHLHRHFALLFPWFVMAMGLLVYFGLTRFAHFLPYTAIMFLLGILMGIGIVGIESNDMLAISTRMWTNIDSHTLLMGFLPGLLFRDAYCSNVFLFMKAIPQSLLLAFPAVLAGTYLTGLVGYYILPYDWSWFFCLTFGSIMSATDPVAVSALLNEVGAPPRLKTHISGESLLNDGSAIVFYTIFSSIWLYELNIGLGSSIDLAGGFALFFRMSLGAVAVGFAFALGLLSLVYLLNRRFNYEESIVQVTASITTAYLSYYVAEAICGMSGVIAVVTCGVMTKLMASSIFNDPDMMEKFWVLVEHLLNSLLFTLGGTVWGIIISNMDTNHNTRFHAEDWGYLFVVYGCLMVIRGILVGCFYPIFSRVGLGSSWQEALFMVFGGLRGAVGIALAIALDNQVQAGTFLVDPRRRFTTELFFMVGGIAFLTLFINGVLAGPFLKSLGLADIGEARQKVVNQYRGVVKLRMFRDVLEFLGDQRFAAVDFSIVKAHISFFDDLTPQEMRYAIKHHKENSPILDYQEPNLRSLKPFFDDDTFSACVDSSKINSGQRLRAVVGMATLANLNTTSGGGAALADETGVIDEERMVELRKVFVDLLEVAYEGQFDSGEVDVRDSLLVYALKASVDSASDDVANGKPLDDWAALQRASSGGLRTFVTKRKEAKKYQSSRRGSTFTSGGDTESNTMSADDVTEFSLTKALCTRAVAFIESHQRAQKLFKQEFCHGKIMSVDEVALLAESTAQMKKAEEDIKAANPAHVKLAISHLLCSILLSKGAEFVGELTERGLLRDPEAEGFLHHIEHDIDHISFSMDSGGSHHMSTTTPVKEAPVEKGTRAPAPAPAAPNAMSADPNVSC